MYFHANDDEVLLRKEGQDSSILICTSANAAKSLCAAWNSMLREYGEEWDECAEEEYRMMQEL